MKKNFRISCHRPATSCSSRLFGSTWRKTLFPSWLEQSPSQFTLLRFFSFILLFPVLCSAPACSKEAPKALPAKTEITNHEIKTMDNEARIKELTEMQRKVTQEEATEPPFKNEYWDEKRDGLYVDIVSGKALFSSKDKYDSGCGWPSFTQPLEKKNIDSKTDNKLFQTRVEVHSTDGTHLGHVFEDGPKDKGGLRYCINSASLKFIPKDEMIKAGYKKEYDELFGKK